MEGRERECRLAGALCARPGAGWGACRTWLLGRPAGARSPLKARESIFPPGAPPAAGFPPPQPRGPRGFAGFSRFAQELVLLTARARPAALGRTCRSGSSASRAALPPSPAPATGSARARLKPVSFRKRRAAAGWTLGARRGHALVPGPPGGEHRDPIRGKVFPSKFALLEGCSPTLHLPAAPPRAPRNSLGASGLGLEGSDPIISCQARSFKKKKNVENKNQGRKAAGKCLAAPSPQPGVLRIQDPLPQSETLRSHILRTRAANFFFFFFSWRGGVLPFGKTQQIRNLAAVSTYPEAAVRSTGSPGTWCRRAAGPRPPRKSRAAAGSRRGTSACSDPRMAAVLWPPKVQLHPVREETPRSVCRHRRRRLSSGRAAGARAGGGSAFRGSGPTQPGRESAF